MRINLMKTLWAAGAAVLLAGLASAQPGSCCRGNGRGQGMMDADHRADMALFRYLLDHRDRIQRTVTEIDNGVVTVTESDDAEVRSRLREHVKSMYARVDEGRPIHARDPLFAEISRHADQIQMTMEDTERGIRIRETSEDPYVAKLIKAHAKVVDAFLENGHAEMMKDHPVPER